MKKPKFFCCPTFSIKSNLCIVFLLLLLVISKYFLTIMSKFFL